MVSPGDDDYDHVSHDRGQVCQQVHQEEEVPQVLDSRKHLQNELLNGRLIFYLHCYLCFSDSHHSLLNLWNGKYYH